jgi:hypothetical protein
MTFIGCNIMGSRGAGSAIYQPVQPLFDPKCNYTLYKNSLGEDVEVDFVDDTYVNSKLIGVGLGDSIPEGQDAVDKKGYLYDLETYVRSDKIAFGTFNNISYSSQTIADIAPDGFGGEDVTRNITEACLRQNADYVVIEILSNDVNLNSIPVSTLKDTIDAIVTEAEVYGTDIIWGTVIPRIPNLTPQKTANNIELSEYIRGLTSEIINIFIYDAELAFSLPGQIGHLNPDLSDDGIHPDPASHYNILWLQLLKPIMLASIGDPIPATGSTKLSNDAIISEYGETIDLNDGLTRRFIYKGIPEESDSGAYYYNVGNLTTSEGIVVQYTGGRYVVKWFYLLGAIAQSLSLPLIDLGEPVVLDIEVGAFGIKTTQNGGASSSGLHNSNEPSLVDREGVGVRIRTGGSRSVQAAISVQSDICGVTSFLSRLWGATDPNANKFFSSTGKVWTLEDLIPFGSMYPYIGEFNATTGAHLVSDNPCPDNNLILVDNIAITDENGFAHEVE